MEIHFSVCFLTKSAIWNMLQISLFRRVLEIHEEIKIQNRNLKKQRLKHPWDRKYISAFMEKIVSIRTMCSSTLCYERTHLTTQKSTRKVTGIQLKMWIWEEKLKVTLCYRPLVKGLKHMATQTVILQLLKYLQKITNKDLNNKRMIPTLRCTKICKSVGKRWKLRWKETQYTNRKAPHKT